MQQHTCNYAIHMKDPMIVFFSWQSTLLKETHMGFIMRALEKVQDDSKESVGSEFSVPIIVDDASRDWEGSPHLLQLIQEKIANSDMFVADLSLCYFSDGNGTRAFSPNPNVMMELGMAVQGKGWKQVILLFNLASGNIRDLPFDIEKRGIIMFKAEENQEMANEQAFKKLTEELSNRIVKFQKANSRPDESLYEAAMNSVRKKKSPDRKQHISAYCRDIIKSLSALGAQFESLLTTMEREPNNKELYRDLRLSFQKSFEDTSPLVADFSNLSQAISSRGDKTSLLAISNVFLNLIEHCDVRAGEPLHHVAYAYEFWRRLTLELFTIFIGHLFAGKRHKQILQVLDFLNEKLEDVPQDGRTALGMFTKEVGFLNSPETNEDFRTTFKRRAESAGRDINEVYAADLLLCLLDGSHNPQKAVSRRWVPTFLGSYEPVAGSSVEKMSLSKLLRIKKSEDARRFCESFGIKDPSLVIESISNLNLNLSRETEAFKAHFETAYADK